MKINKAVETELGTVKFEGELSQVEFDYVLQAGLNALLVMGAISVKTSADPIEESNEEIPEGTQIQ